jgi:hypothetical protein
MKIRFGKLSKSYQIKFEWQGKVKEKKQDDNVLYSILVSI